MLGECGVVTEPEPQEQSRRYDAFLRVLAKVARAPARIFEAAAQMVGLVWRLLGLAWRILGTRNWLRTSVLTFAYLLLLYFLDPIGVATNSARSSEELFYRIVAPDYPNVGFNGEPPDGSDNRNRIVVILINDATLQALGETWPPALSVHARVLDKVLGESAPRAVFVDFGFFDARDPKAVNTLASILRKHALPTQDISGASELWPWPFRPEEAPALQGSIPVFLPSAPKGLRVIESLKNSVTGLVSTRITAMHEQKRNRYQLYDNCLGLPSPALALYAVEGKDWPSWKLTGCPPKPSWRGRPKGMSVYWATWGGEDDGRGIYPCLELPETRGGRLWLVLKIWFDDLLGRDDSWADQFQSCPPHLALAAHDVLADESGGYAEILLDAFVIYGGNFAMADDLVVPPTHRPVPGAFLHAMALDNLARLRPYIGRSEDRYLIDGSSWLTLGTAILMSLIIALAWTGQEVLAKSMGRGALARVEGFAENSLWNFVYNKIPYPFPLLIIRIFWVTAFVLLSIAVVILAIWFGFYVLHWAPANFVGLLAFLGVHTVIRSVRELLHSII